MDLGEQSTEPVRQAGRFGGQVVVEPDQNLELGQRFLADVDSAQRMRNGPGRVGDHIRVAGVGLGRPRVQIGDPAHRQTGQVGHREPHGTGDRDRQRADRVGLVDHDQHPSVFSQTTEQVPQPVLVLWQRRVEDPSALSRPGHTRGEPPCPHRARRTRRTDGHPTTPILRIEGDHGAASAAGSHVTKRPRQVHGQVPISGRPTPPDPATTPPGSLTTGAASHTGPSDRSSPPGRATRKVTDRLRMPWALRDVRNQAERACSRQEGVLRQHVQPVRPRPGRGRVRHIRRDRRGRGQRGAIRRRSGRWRAAGTGFQDPIGDGGDVELVAGSCKACRA